MIATLTGHRDIELSERLHDLLAFAIGHWDVTDVWCGMAKGWDLYAGMVVDNYEIPLHLAYIYYGTRPPRDEPWNGWFKHLSNKHAERRHIVTKTVDYQRWLPLERNTFMLDRSDFVIAAWNGVEKGGTWDTVRKARAKNMPVLVIDPKQYTFRIELNEQTKTTV